MVEVCEGMYDHCFGQHDLLKSGSLWKIRFYLNSNICYQAERTVTWSTFFANHWHADLSSEINALQHVHRARPHLIQHRLLPCLSYRHVSSITEILVGDKIQTSSRAIIIWKELDFSMRADMVVSWLCPGCVMVVSWLCHGCVMVVSWLSIHRCQMKLVSSSRIFSPTTMAVVFLFSLATRVIFVHSSQWKCMTTTRGVRVCYTGLCR